MSATGFSTAAHIVEREQSRHAGVQRQRLTAQQTERAARLPVRQISALEN
jgi:hypothetical protein